MTADQTSRGAHKSQASSLSSLGGDATISLRLEQSGALVVKQFDFILTHGRMRLSFNEDMPLEDVFRDEIVEAIGYLVARVGDTSLLSAPEFEVDAGGCNISGATILTSIVKDNATAITVRLRDIRGNAMELLTKNVVPPTVDAELLQRTIDDALNRIYVPLRNFDAALERAMEERRDGDVDRLHAQILAFRSEIDTVCFNFERLLSEEIARLDKDGELGLARQANLRIIPRDS
ncbi:hypothetical protein [Pontivivens insulae]|uniref:Uncharacterized protein n=1 Tax=Pontivivens insulae TaxID=1639689 RepID=A0A2R8ABH7_9RHOB|nr:hypothetical protein [Pontivivens insulae]RED11250.1 hypothetical protein DFR53_3283 [Pontivivens insulae]SPF29577.1 hypothetical protein POI8812_01890 [Pontivivens insulae]